MGHPCAVSPSLAQKAKDARAKSVTLFQMSLKWHVSEAALSRAINGVGAYGRPPYVPTAGASPSVAGGASGDGEEAE